MDPTVARERRPLAAVHREPEPLESQHGLLERLDRRQQQRRVRLAGGRERLLDRVGAPARMPVDDERPLGGDAGEDLGVAAPVAAGQPIGLLQVGPLLLPLATPCNGAVVATLADDGAAVGYGQPLITFWPSDG